MKNKLPIFSLIALLLLIVASVIFVFNDFSSKGENSLLGEHSRDGRRGGDREGLNDDDNSKFSNKRSVQNQSSGDAEFIAFDEDVVSVKNESSSNHENANSGETESILEANKEQAQALIELTLLDGVTKKTLPNLEVKVRAKYSGKWQDHFSLTTNEEGKINFKIKHRGYVSFQILANEYSYYDVFVARDEKSSYIVELLKGGVLEVKINTSDKKMVESVVATMMGESRFLRYTWYAVDELRHFMKMSYDSVQDVYILKNLPIGFNLVSFKAPGYEDSREYKFFMNSDRTSRLEVNLVPVRTLLLDLDVAEKCDFIYISEMPRRGEQDELLMYNFLTATEEIGLKYQNNLPQSMRQTLNSGMRGDMNMFKIRRNSQNLFEYELLAHDSFALMLFAGNYAPKYIVLTPDDDRYKVSMAEDFDGKIILKDENGDPIANATVDYSWRYPLEPHERLKSYQEPPFELTTKSDVNGVAYFMGGSEGYSAKIFHKNYEKKSVHLNFDEKTRIITMTTAKSVLDRISGRVLFQEKPIIDAKVCLYKVFYNHLHHLDCMNSEESGRYLFGDSVFDTIDEMRSNTYALKAFHKDFGVATVEEINLHDGNKKIDLHLKESMSIVRVVDTNQKPLENVRVRLTTDLNPNFSATYVTNQEGQIRLLNMEYPSYDVHLENSQYRLKDSQIKVPNDSTTLVAEPLGLRRVHISIKNGVPFQGVLAFSVGHSFMHLNVITDGNDAIYLDVSNLVFLGRDTYIVFKAQDHAFVTKGPFRRRSDIPQEFYIELEEEEKFSVKVLDKETNQPLSSVSMEIHLGHYNIRSFYTNELGEASFMAPAGKFDVIFQKHGYTSYANKEFGRHESKNVTIYLEKYR